MDPLHRNFVCSPSNLQNFPEILLRKLYVYSVDFFSSVSKINLLFSRGKHTRTNTLVVFLLTGYSNNAKWNGILSLRVHLDVKVKSVTKRKRTFFLSSSSHCDNFCFNASFSPNISFILLRRSSTCKQNDTEIAITRHWQSEHGQLATSY